MADVIGALGIPADLARVVLVNGHDAAADRPLEEGDEVAIFPPLAGGAGQGAGSTAARSTIASISAPMKSARLDQ